MLRKGFTKCITFVLAAAFLLSSVAAVPAMAGELEESEIDSQVQSNNTEAVEDEEESKAESSEISEESKEKNSEISVDNNADSNAANIPEQNTESSSNPNEEETAGGESSKSDESDNAAVEESKALESENSQMESSVMEDSNVEESKDDEEEDDELQQIAEENMEAISLFSNSNARLLSMNAGISLLSAGANDSNMGLAPGIQFQKFEIQYNKYPTNTVEYIVIHDTGNTKPGSNAMSHYEYFKGGDRDASAHYFVDDRQVVQIIDDSEGSWHSGVKYKTPATPISNQNSIGIEMCINSDGNYNQAMKNTIDLTAYLMWKYNLDMDHVVRHYDANGKICPLTMSENGWADWYEFKAAVQAKRNTYTGQYSGDEKQESDEGVHYSNAIMGASTLSAEAMVAHLTDKNPEITKDYAARVANAYLTISQYYGIRGDIAFFQAMLETGNLKYGGEVDVSYNNFCGMKAHGDTEEKYDYAKFATVEEGVEAHLQHIYCYASTQPLPSGRKLVDPRFYDWLRGRSTTWEGLSGIWAQPGYDPNEYASLEEAQDKHGTYGDIIIRMYASAGGTNVQTGPAIRGSVGSVAEDNYWDSPIYTGPAAGTRSVLRLGQTGSDVKELQGYLKTIGYTYVEVNGTFDKNTERAVLDIQKKNGLDVDGIVGEYTWTAVINTYVNVILAQNGKDAYPDPGLNNGDVPDSDQISDGKGESSGNSGGSNNGNSGSGNTNSGSSNTGSSNTGSSNTGTSSGTTTTPQPTKPVVPVISVSGRSMVYNGCSGGDVKALQQLLNRLGYGLAEDGIFGGGTDAAVRDFQAKNGLDVDGYVGPASWKVLGEKGNAGASTGSTGSSGSSTGSSANSGSSGSSSNSSSSGSSSGNSGAATGTGISVTGRSMVSYGSSGADVKALQQLLNILGYGLVADGIFGGGTNSAVMNFQSKQGLVVDGYVGSATWAALGKACGSSNASGSTGSSSNGSGTSASTGSSNTNVSTSGRPTVSYGDSGSNVTALQQLLNKHGYGLVEDGIFGGGTAAAVQRFQASQGLVADGIVGPLTWAKL